MQNEKIQEDLAQKNKKSLWFFLLTNFALTWGLCLVIWLGGGLEGPRALLLSACMMVPAVTALATKFIFRLPWGMLALRLHLKKYIFSYAFACWGPALLIVGGGAVYFLLFPGHFDPSGNGQGLSLGMMSGGLVLAAIVAPLLNVVPCAGEELGWRGLLLSQLLKSGSPRRAVLLSGLIWGLWHAPMIAMGHNYGLDYSGWPWLGIFAMILFCCFLGCIFGYLRLRTGSFWPAVLAHGSLNGMASAAMIFLAPGAETSPFIGPLPTGIIGGCLLAAAGVLCFFLLGRVKQDAAAPVKAGE